MSIHTITKLQLNYVSHMPYETLLASSMKHTYICHDHLCTTQSYIPHKHTSKILCEYTVQPINLHSCYSSVFIIVLLNTRKSHLSEHKITGFWFQELCIPVCSKVTSKLFIWYCPKSGRFHSKCCIWKQIP